MKGTVFFVLALLFFGSGAAFGQVHSDGIQSHSVSVSFGVPCVVDEGSSVTVHLPGAAACVYHPGQPVLPLFTTTLQLPFGSHIKDVSINFTEVNTIILDKKITAAPYPFIDGSPIDPVEPSIDTDIYESVEFYPPQWVTYTTGGGLNQDSKHVTFVTIRVFPTRYSPMTNILLYLSSCQITLLYELSTKSPFPSVVSNDLVIICPSQFVLPLKPLAEHKNNLGIRTEIISLQEIYRDYSGYDRPEQIKYFIKDAIERWGTSYILLVGGLKSHVLAKPRDNLNTGIRDWHLPVRYSNLWDLNHLYDPGFISDLYYADIYNGSGGFCSWDSGNDGVFGGWSNPIIFLDNPTYPTDQIDFYPDVYLGRLPCRNIWEVTIIVHKIITYEKKPADLSWFNRMVVVAGDPYDDQGTHYLEGELIGEKALMHMPGFEQRALFASNKATNSSFTPTTQNIVREINTGCGFLFFDGHGGPFWWNTYWPDEFDTLIKNGGITIYQFYQLRNSEMLPVCIIGGCHNNLFNVSLLLTTADFRNRHFLWSDGFPIPECWGWSLTVKPNGGAIATIGNTGLGYEAGGEVGDLNGDELNEPDCVEALCGYLETQFFKGYGMKHIDIVGKLWNYAIEHYLQVYPGMDGWSDAKTIEQWMLFGDPSLKIGGYPS